MSFIARVSLFVCLLLSASACTVLKNALEPEELKAWERDILAQDKMQLDANRMDLMADEKIYFSREASRGGGGFGGGGCGCN